MTSTSPSNGGQPDSADTPEPIGASAMDPIVIDPHDGATADDVAAYFATAATFLATTAQELGVRPSSITVMRMFETRGAEVAIPEGDKAAVDALGDKFGLGHDDTTSILYQRTGDLTLAGDSAFLRVFCYTLGEIVEPPAAAAEETPPVDVEVVAPAASIPTPATQVDVLPVLGVPRPAETVPSA